MTYATSSFAPQARASITPSITALRFFSEPSVAVRIFWYISAMFHHTP